jgi:Outer membrane protein beta-barrel domain
MKHFFSILFSGALLAPAALAQRWDFGLFGAGAIYNSQSVTLGSASASAGFSNGFGGGVWVGQNHYRYVGGEIRYGYLRNDLKLNAGSTTATFGGEAHAIHYDFLLYTKPVGAKVRPYFAGGGGLKIYRGTGTEVVSQPGSQFALLTRTTDARPMISVGTGVRWTISPRMGVRIEFRDYMTPFPKGVIAPNSGAKVGGWIHDFLPMVGLSFGGAE